MALATSKSSPRDQAQETSERDIVRMKPMHPHSGSIDEHDTEVLLSRFRSDGKISRRHSTQLAPGVEYPIEEAVGEGTTDGLHQKKKILRRSSSIRGIAQTSKVLLTGLSRAGVATRSSDAIDEGKRADIVSKESPYEEMMVRFQIRQLQRTASEMTTRSDDKRVSSRGHDADGTGRGSIGHGSLATERTTRQDFDAQQGNGHITQDGSKSITPGDSLGLVSPLDNSNNEKLATQGPTHQCDASKQNRPTKLWFQNWWRIPLTPISPLSEFTHVRYMLILFVATTYVVFFPLGVAFPDEQQFTYVDSVVGILLGLDVLVALHTSYMKNDGTIVSSHRDIAVHYLRTRFVQDVLLSIPLILHVNALTGKHIAGSWLHFILDLLSAERIAYVSRFVRMVWLVRLNQSGGGNNFWAWLLYSRYSHLLRIAGIVTMLIAIAHYIACNNTQPVSTQHCYCSRVRACRPTLPDRTSSHHCLC
ncbi:unnamed protein product [Phytophthora lilii]|uniref:Unnamed protein product n=1 Tax=Phytophthora lilii TaxID=2077276 RepID=A0A9W6TWV5_9STRA|nr:unnamed protein product [Phytophthora lilii]